jgi:phenylalanyl-tRNA synthetase alpha subunit
MSDLQQILEQGLEAIAAAKEAKLLEDVRVEFMGKKGRLSQFQHLTNHRNIRRRNQFRAT